MKICLIIFDDFTDIDLFFLWDVLARKSFGWDVKILGTQPAHSSSNGLLIPTHGNLTEANQADVVLFSSGKGVQLAINNAEFIGAFQLNPEKQLIGSMCSGALILAKLGLLNNLTATTYPTTKHLLVDMGITVIDAPFVHHGNIATAGGCLSAQYLTAWVIEKMYGADKRKAVMKVIAPVGQAEVYEDLVTNVIGSSQVTEEMRLRRFCAILSPH